MTPFTQPAVYTPPPSLPSSPSPAASISRSDRFLASTPPARNDPNNGYIDHSSSNTIHSTTSLPSSTTAAARCVHSKMHSIPTTTSSTTTTTHARWDQGREDKAEEEEETRQGQKQKQEEEEQLCQEQGPCTLASSPALTHTPSNTLTLGPTSDTYIYSATTHSQSVHMQAHQSPRPIMQHQQRQHSLAHKKDAPYYYISQQQQQQEQHQQHYQQQQQQQQQYLQSHLSYTSSAQHTMVSLQREPSRRSFSSRQLQGKGAQPSNTIGLVRTPDPRYLEAFEGYFDHSRLEDSAALGIASGDETASDEKEDENNDDGEDEEPKIRWAFSYKANRDGLPRRERRRSRSVCGVVSPPASPTSSSPWTSPPSRDPYDGLVTPMSRTSSLLVSPAMDGTVTTPPPSKRVSYSSRRRHHSCVAPNAKDFQTLATIFGWVTDTSAAHIWPVRSDEEEEKEEEEEEEGQGQASIRSILDSSPQYLARNGQTTTCACDDDSDLEDCLRQSSSSASWCTSRESRDSELSQGRVEGRFEHNPQSSNGSIEFLDESNEGTHAVASSWKSSSRSSRNNWQTETPESESACPSESSSSLSTPTPPQLHSVDDFIQQVRSHVLQPCHVVSFPEGVTDDHSLLLTTSPLPQATRGLHRSDTMSTKHSYESLSSPRDSEQLGSPYTQCSNSTLISPLLCSHDKDSRYMNFSYNKHGVQPLESFVTSVAQSLNNLSDQCCSNRSEDVQADKAATLTSSPNGDWKNASEQDAAEPPAPPPISPRYPEIDLRVFDHSEKESQETIVYAPIEGYKRESLSGTLELRPIVAATIVKLIEKLTHHYGLDSGFMADFFLTYRLFMSPMQLCKYLIQRYLWALEEDTEFRCVIRVRTFVVFRFWINNHFADDFLTSKSLRFQMASFLNEMRFNGRVQASPRDSRIIRNLMDFFKHQRRYYKGLAQQSATAELERYQRQHKYDAAQSNKIRSGPGQDSGSGVVQRRTSTEGMTDSAATKSAEAVAARLRVLTVHRQVDPVTGKVTTSDVTDAAHAPHPTKGRHRAYTLGGMITAKPANSDVSGKHANAKPPLSKEPRIAQQMGRQPSEGNGLFTPRERRLSSSSVKSYRSTSTWPTKFVNKIRQKSEDFYQQIVHSSSGGGAAAGGGSQHKGADSKHQCVCWTLAYIGISEHHALNTARSFPNLRPTVISNQYQPHQQQQHQQQQQQDTVGSGVGSNASSSIPGLPSNKSIKRLKSSLNLGLHSASSTIPPPAASPTKNQNSGISSRHSRTSSNSSVGYHPNPECPYHVPCIEAIQTETIKPSSESTLCDSGSSSATFTTLKEALQESCGYNSESGSSSHSQSGGIIPASPSWNYGPWYSSAHQLFPTMVPPPPYKPFILFYRSQLIAQQLCLLEQHFLENVKWDELLEVELCRAGRKSRSKVQSSIGGYLFRTEGEPNGMDASNERSNMLCMWVASEVVSTRVLDDRVRVIEKFIRIAQKCYQYRNFSSLMQLVMGLGSSPLCGLRRTWARVNSYEMRILHDLQDFISPFGNWSYLRKAMNQVGYQETVAEKGQRLSVQSSDAFGSSFSSIGQDANGTGSHVHTATEPGHSKYLQYQAPLDRQGCIPFLGLFVFDLTHIAVSPSWFLSQVAATAPSHSSANGSDSEENSGNSADGASSQNGLGSIPSTPMKANHMAAAARLEAPEPKDLQDLLPSGTLLVHFYRYQLIAKTIKWFMAFQQRSPKYTFPVDSTLYSKCYLLRVLTKERVKELAVKCESE